MLNAERVAHKYGLPLHFAFKGFALCVLVYASTFNASSHNTHYEKVRARVCMCARW